MTNIDELEVLATAAGGDEWTPTYGSRIAPARVWLPDGDAIASCFASIGHQPEAIDEDDVAEYIGAVSPAKVLALIAEVRALRETIKSQASAARAGMDAAKSGASILYQEAVKARAESSPDVLASERAMNAMLTEENEALREDAERYRWAIAYEDNAETLLAAVMNNAPDKMAISAEIDEERAKEKA